MGETPLMQVMLQTSKTRFSRAGRAFRAFLCAGNITPNGAAF